MREALAEALAHKGGPVVVDAVVDPYALSLPAHVPFHVAKGFTLSNGQTGLGREDGFGDQVDRTERAAGVKIHCISSLLW